MSGVELHHGSATDVGRVREVNEDAFLVAPPLFVVADGMGGHDRGDAASRIVVEVFGTLATDAASADNVSATRAVEAALVECHRRLAALDEAGRASGDDHFSAGTTAVVALLVTGSGEPRWLLANLGDSRVYRYHDGVLEQLSTDHSVVQELVDAGEISRADAALHPERHVVTRALGGEILPDADFFLAPVADAERLLLCTDGVSGLIDDATMARIMAGGGGPPPAPPAPGGGGGP
ncbi:PP2C family serine/threonine-protein phosphatase, partial [Nocardioides sp. R-C-SC26]|uniref:PP2C family protein-serine/threonine phosphatase n=1 Tax=Nocardioides sp. R-C-SC26 TaxID=2870414 RepID=UPI001E3F8C68